MVVHHPCEAVFISDLHLHPENAEIHARFIKALDWITKHTKTLYILGDFLHVWPGDDGLDSWSLGICEQLKKLKELGITVYFMSGNRDFLIGQDFIKVAGMTLLTEPTVITLGEMQILLVHGDRYCTKDKWHQFFRTVTRHPWFGKYFLKLPLKLRRYLVNGIRGLSQKKKYQPEKMSTIPEAVVKHMQTLQVQTLIHGHTHTPGLIEHHSGAKIFKQYILSDWDDKPQLLCYDKSKGLYFIHAFMR